MSAPFVIPCLGYEVFRFDRIETLDSSRMEGRRLETASFGTPYWALKATTGQIRKADFDAVLVFFEQVQRAGATFAVYDYFRQRPSAYGATPLTGTKAAGGAFDGTGAIYLIADPLTVTVSGLPAGFAVNAAAWVEFRVDASTRSLHRIAAAATADAGGFLALQLVQPLDATIFPAGTVANFERPSCVMRLNAKPEITADRVRRVVSFTADEAF